MVFAWEKENAHMNKFSLYVHFLISINYKPKGIL